MVNIRQVGPLAWRWAPWGVSLVALFLTLRALLMQAAVQDDLGAAMERVHRNVQQAKQLTKTTAASLEPLAATSDKLAAMNEKLAATRLDLVAMNKSMGRVNGRQQQILERVISLNGNTEGVIAGLRSVDKGNKALLGTTRILASQTGRQAQKLTTLSGLTEQAIGHLVPVNRRLRFMQQL